MITVDRNLLSGGEVPQDVLRRVLSEHAAIVPHLAELKKYYEGDQDILRRKRAQGLPNNRIVNNYARYIVTMTSGYLTGQPVAYTAPEGQEAALQSLLEAYDEADTDSVDAELSAHAAIYGRGVEVLFADANARPQTAAVSPLGSFVVYDDTVENAPVFGVRAWVRSEGPRKQYFVDVYTESEIYHYSGTSYSALALLGSEAHYFGGVPVVEYWNNEDERGDFEPVMSLMDAYNAIQSDRVNDKQQFTDAILLTRGFSGITDSADPQDKRTPGQRLNDEKLLMLSDKDSDASFITKQLSQADTEVLKTALSNDIHKFSLVPDLTDEQFAANASGVAMKFKLFGLEQLTKIKERWFREGLQARLRLFADFLSTKGMPALDANRVQITFTRAMPANELELAQMVSTLQGLVPNETLLTQLPFVKDVAATLEMLSAQKAEDDKRQADMFGARYPDGNIDQEE